MTQTGTAHSWRGRLWRYAPLILWTIVIFAASSSAGSMSNTSRIIRPLLEFLFPSISELQLLMVHGFVRKVAHLAFYFVLGALAARAFSTSLKPFLLRNWIVISFVLVVIIAYLDETNQSFLTSRTSSMRDVLIDVCGGAMALLIWFLATKSRKRHRTGSNKSSLASK
jgi:VanZ family protein